MPFLRPTDAEIVRARLSELERDVRLILFVPSTGGLSLPGPESEASERTQMILREVADLSPRVILEVHSVLAERALAEQHRVQHLPATIITADDHDRVRYVGIPAGYEFATLLEAILDAGRESSALAPATLEALAALEREVHLRVFVTPT